MALSFNKAAGGAKKSSITSYSYRDGDNEVRLVGDVLARYVYWLEGKNGKNIPFECLSFDRNEERFNNMEKDWVREYYPDLKCGWSYAMQCLDQGEVRPGGGVILLCWLILASSFFSVALGFSFFSFLLVFPVPIHSCQFPSLAFQFY